MVKEFITAVEEHEAAQSEVEGKPFKIDGRDCVCYPPDPAQVAVLMSCIGRHVSYSTKVAGVIDFFSAVLDEDTAAWVRTRLLDRKDPFGIDQVTDICLWMVEQWTGRPTEEPSGS